MRKIFLTIAITAICILVYTIEGFAQTKSTEGKSSSGSLGDISYYVNAAGEIYFFNIIGGKQKSKSEDDHGNITSYDYTGRKYKMNYNISPVYLGSVEAFARWNSMQFDLIYKSNRFQSGGSVDYDADVASEITNNKAASEIIKLGIKYFNLETSFRSVQFDFGRADVVNVATGEVEKSGNIKLNIRQADIRYDICELWNRKNYKLYAGYTFMQYSLPRIIYRMKDTNPDGGDDEWVYDGETIAQNVTLNSHLAGLGVTFGERKSVDGFFSSEIFLGGGGTELDFRAAENSPEDKRNKNIYCSMINSAAGIAVKLPSGDIASSLKITYEINLLGYSAWEGFYDNTSERDDSGEKDYLFNSFDIFHGLFVSLNASF